MTRHTITGAEARNLEKISRARFERGYANETYPDSQDNELGIPTANQPAECGNVAELKKYDELAAKYPELALELRWLEWEEYYHAEDCRTVEDCNVIIDDANAICKCDGESSWISGLYAVGNSAKFGQVIFDLRGLLVASGGPRKKETDD